MIIYYTLMEKEMGASYSFSCADMDQGIQEWTK